MLAVLWSEQGGLTALVRDGIPAFFQMIGMVCWYLITWAGWFQSSNAYFRRWAVENPARCHVAS